MSKLLLVLTALFAIGIAHSAELEACTPVGENNRLTGPAVSLQELEKIGLSYAARNPRAPQVPFAYGHETWLQLKKLHQAGDRIHPYEQLWPPSGKPFAWGYALVRDDCILGVIGTRVS